MTTCSSDEECVSGAVCSQGTCRKGEPAFNGGGVSGCSAAGSASSSGAGAFTFFALLALGLLRRRAGARAAA